MAERTEKESLRGLLDALDARAPDLLDRVAARPREGRFLGALARHGLDDLEALLVLEMLRRRLADLPVARGAELVAGLPLDAADRLEATARLAADGRLLAAGFLLPEVAPADGADAHETRFRLGEHVLRLACAVFERRAPEPEQRAATGPYRSNGELLADLRRLSLLYRRRAGRLFQLDPWAGAGLEATHGVAETVRRARAAAAHVAERLAATPGDARFPLLALRAEHRLDVDALVVLVTMLFHEVVEGVGSVPAADLVKLVSESESALLRRRQMLRPLARRGLLRLEGVYAGKDTTADASLPNEVVDRMLGTDASPDADERLGFHEYLAELRSSDPFFLDMENGGLPGLDEP